MPSPPSFSGTIPHHYETYLGPLFFEPYAVDLAQRVAAGTAGRTLELACGTGRVTRQLINRLAREGVICATDLNEDMLRLANAKLQDQRIEWAVADAQELPFEGNLFDLVICQFGVMFFPDKEKAFAEAFRVLKPGGRFLFNTWDALRFNALAQLTEQALQETFPVDTPACFMRGPHSFCDPAEIEQLLTGAGFEKIALTNVEKTGVAASPEEAVKGVLDGTPLSAFLQGQGAQTEKARERLAALLKQHYGESDLALPMQAFVCEAVKP